MTVVVEITVPADDFPLGRILSWPADLKIELLTAIPLANEFIPYIWIEGEAQALTQFESHLEDKDYISSITCVDEEDRRHLCRIDWNAPINNGLIGYCRENDVVIDRANGVADEWHFRMVTEEHETHEVKTLIETCEMSISIDRVLSSVSSTKMNTNEISLTKAQKEAIETALEQGFFNTPSEITLEELADQFGISRQAISTRLDGGIRKIVENTELS